MLKKFFISFLGSMAAIWLSTLLLSMGFVIFILALIGSNLKSSAVKEHSILLLNIHGSITERHTDPSLKDIITQEYDATVPSLDDMVKSLSIAASDPKIDGVYIKCNGASMSYAACQELIEAIEDFKKSGKWVYAYSDGYNQVEYYLSSAANRVYVNTTGSVDIHGIGAQVPFFKNALDKLGVDVQVFKVGTYKSAVEPFILTEMSEPARQQSEVYLSSIWDDITKGIAKARKKTTAEVNTWADSLLVTVPTDSLKTMGVVDELCYRHEIEDKLRSLTSINKGDDLRFVTPDEYLYAPNVKYDIPSPDKPHIAVLYAVGDITDTGTEGISAETMVPQIIDLADDDNVKGLVLRVNSGGGSAFASEQIWEALEYFKKTGKPYYVSMGAYAASGGYYISCGADKIYCDPATLTGSIGIFGMIPNFEGLLNNHLGINISTVGTTPNATFPSVTSPMSTTQYQAMQNNVNNGYRLFTSRVANGRKMPLDSVLTIAEGRVWDGNTALKLGLVDGHSSLNGVVKMLTKATDLKETQAIAYPLNQGTDLQQLMKSLSHQAKLAQLYPEASNALTQLTPDDFMQYIKIIGILKSGTTIYTRMEDITIK